MVRNSFQAGLFVAASRESAALHAERQECGALTRGRYKEFGLFLGRFQR
jgi:hypothetical protein